MDDLISRRSAIKAICEDSTWLESQGCTDIWMAERKQRDVDILSDLPSVQSEPNYCRECKWSRNHIYMANGKSETYWRCLNWDGETDEEGYCHEWERRTE